MRLIPQFFSRYRPRVLTVIVFILIAALIVLANLSFDRGGSNSVRHKSYGWPLIWHRYVYLVSVDIGYTIGWYFHAGRLAANLALWLVLIAAPVAGCEWLLHRYRPRFRWSLRTQLGAVGLTAALCALFAAARNRANVQDELTDAIRAAGGQVWVEQRGPKWLDLIGAGRLRRQIVRVEGLKHDFEWRDDELQRLLKGLARLPDFQSLSVEVRSLTPDLAEALSEMRQLRALSISILDLDRGAPDALLLALTENSRLAALAIETSGNLENSHEYISDKLVSAVGTASRLEYLRLSGMFIDKGDLAGLVGLKNLKTLCLKSVYYSCDPKLDPPMLSDLPVFPRLGAFHASFSNIADDDLRYLVALPRLKSVTFSNTEITGTGLAELAALKSLEEVTIEDKLVSSSALRALCAVKGLNRLHMCRYAGQKTSLDDGELLALPEPEFQECLATLDALRKSNRGIVIDSDKHVIYGYMGYQDLLEIGEPLDPAYGERWLPSSDARWATASERAAFDAAGAWARFDGFGYRKNGRAFSVSF